MNIIIYLIITIIFIAFSDQALSTTVILRWKPVLQKNIAGYKIYYGSNSRVYNERIDVGNVTSYSMYLKENEQNYIALTAYYTEGNESWYSDEIFVTNDHASPDGSVVINNGRSSTFSRVVILELKVTDSGSGMGKGAEMKLSNSYGTWSYEGPYFRFFPWLLSQGRGEKKVYALFKDAAGNWSKDPVFSTISYK